jgi:hypothetical protein
MRTVSFSRDLRFKLLAIGSQISLTDAAGQLVFYVRKKSQQAARLLRGPLPH